MSGGTKKYVKSSLRRGFRGVFLLTNYQKQFIICACLPMLKCEAISLLWPVTAVVADIGRMIKQHEREPDCGSPCRYNRQLRILTGWQEVVKLHLAPIRNGVKTEIARRSNRKLTFRPGVY